MKRIVIIGASSGLGRKIALDFARIGWRVGVAARSEEKLQELKKAYPELIEYRCLDVTADDAVERFNVLIEALGGMDYMLYCAGCGWQNPQLDIAPDRRTLEVNVLGFTRIINAAYAYYRYSANDSRGHIAAITSVAGVKGIGISATYSASKRYQWTYLQAIEQLAHIQGVDVAITDIRPGFVDTPLLANSGKYPMEMTVDYAAPRIELAILREKRVAYIDWRWGMVARLWNLLPDSLWPKLNVIR